MAILLEEEIVPLPELYKKNIGLLCFKDIISLVFHACRNLSIDNDMWRNYYKEFEDELILQNKNKCPHLTTISNDFSKRVEIFCDRGFISSNNLLTLLLRLLYIENRKKNYKYGYHKILNYTIPIISFDDIEKISVQELFSLLLKPYLEYYLRIYNDELMFEYQLGLCILLQCTQ